MQKTSGNLLMQNFSHFFAVELFKHHWKNQRGDRAHHLKDSQAEDQQRSTVRKKILKYVISKYSNLLDSGK